MLDKVSTCGNLLHIVAHWEDLGGVYSVIENTQSPKIWLNFKFRGGGGYSVIENTQSPKIWLNFKFRGGGWVFCNWKYSKSQDLPKFHLGGGILLLKILKVPRSG